ncbi:cytochrome c3 family protein [Carboxydocella sp. JDF658]|uniref:cytochrome c3 family protein n=1 Tax=Carboxydocella sp. JDF658 TaxID=1926600 RepID=UPI0009ACB957|nr:cytochrome c3 family protein [Carboxydocella sp. JDF658]AVX31288.1 doubled CXXCH domain-containing protein [Carboxydocella thermautotrophica]GAW30436.1 hypothetical protein JDF658_02010 [Carboxydocella sp. JDF658]
MVKIIKYSTITAITILLLLFHTIQAWAAIDPEATIRFTGMVGGNNQETVYWTSVTGATSYTLSRTADGTTWTTLYTGPATQYADTGVENYRNYYYKVTATDGTTTIESPIGKAFPPNTSPHDYYDQNLGACASCHVTHAAEGPKLLTQKTGTRTCLVCHDGTQSKYNVLNGTVTLPGSVLAPTSSGPFGTLPPASNTTAEVYAAVYYDYNGSAAITAVPTSVHNVGTPHGEAPGEMIYDSFFMARQLDCTSCHNPHDNGNYRLLKSLVGSSSGEQTNAIIGYAVTDTGTNQEIPKYVSGTVYFCGTCHSDFNQKAGSGHRLAKFTEQTGYDLNANSIDFVMHAVNIPNSYNGLTPRGNYPYENGNLVVCLTCHRAHGTTVVEQNITRSGRLSTALKRAPGMVICEDCHQKTDNP